MFVLKTKIGDIELKIPIYEDEIFAVCPTCGCEHEVDVSEIYEDGGSLSGSQVYCGVCSMEMMKQ